MEHDGIRIGQLAKLLGTRPRRYGFTKTLACSSQRSAVGRDTGCMTVPG